MPPTEVQQKILRRVVEIFLTTGRPTAREDLVREFQDLNAINDLASRGVLTGCSGGTYIPTAVAFHYCGSAEAEAFAKRSVHALANVFKSQFLANKPKLTREGILEDAKKFDTSVDERMIELGLFLSPGFPLLTSWTGGNDQQLILTPTRISERVVEIKNADTLWDEYMQTHNPWPAQITSIGDTRPVGDVLVAVPFESPLLEVGSSQVLTNERG